MHLSVILEFIGITLVNYFCTTSPINDPLVYLSLVPLIMNGLSYLLVFVTTVEFICALSPNAMKGLLIGIWYSMLSVKYMVVYVLDTHMFLKMQVNGIYTMVSKVPVYSYP